MYRNNTANHKERTAGLKASKTKLGVFFLVVIFTALIGLLNWRTLNTPFERDEGEYAYAAWILRHGLLPYAHSFLQKPPLIIYTYMLAQSISAATWAPRLLAAVFTVLTAVLVGLIANKEFGKRTGILSLFLLPILVRLPNASYYAANTEIFMILPMTAVFALYVFYRNQTKKWPWFVAGACTALAILYKPICAPVLAFIFLLWLKDTLHQRSSFRQALKNLVIALAGVISAALPSLWIFLQDDKGKRLWEAAVQYNSYYVQQMGFSLTHAVRVMTLFVSGWSALLALITYFFWKKTRYRLQYTGLLLVSLASIYQGAFAHYYIMLIPFITIVISASFFLLIQNLPNERAIRPAFFLYLVLIAATLILPSIRQLFLTEQGLTTLVYSPSNPFVEAEIVAKNLQEITNPSDRVYIAGSEPEILYYAKRFSSSRFVITYPLSLASPVSAQYQHEVANTLSQSLPQAIIIVQTRESGLWYKNTPTFFISYIKDLLASNYEVVGSYVRTSKQGEHWQEKPSKKEIAESSLVLYRYKK